MIHLDQDWWLLMLVVNVIFLVKFRGFFRSKDLNRRIKFCEDVTNGDIFATYDELPSTSVKMPYLSSALAIALNIAFMIIAILF